VVRVRAVFVLDRAGVVRYTWVSDDALVLPDLEAVLAAVKKVN
jgi:peroxiredoxin